METLGRASLIRNKKGIVVKEMGIPRRVGLRGGGGLFDSWTSWL